MSEKSTNDPSKLPATGTPADDGEGTVDFNYYVPPSEGGTGSMQPVHVSEPISGGSVVPWSDLLQQRRQQQAAEADMIPMGSLAELNVDAVSDKDILRRLEREARERAGGSSDILLKIPGQPRQSGIRKKAAILPSVDDPTPHPPSSIDLRVPAAPKEDDGVSSIDLRTAARTANRALSDDESAHGDDDVLSDALMADDGSSAINLGLEPRVAQLLSSAALVREIKQADAAKPVPSKPNVVVPSQAVLKLPKPWVAWAGGTAIGILVTASVIGLAWFGGAFRSSSNTLTANDAPRPGLVNDQRLAFSLTDPKLADLTKRNQELETAVKESAGRLQVSDPKDVPSAIDKLVAAGDRSARDQKETQQKLNGVQTQLTQTVAALVELRRSSSAETTKIAGKLKETQESEESARKSLADAVSAKKSAEDKLIADTRDLRQEVENLRGSMSRVRTADSLLEVWPSLLEKPSRTVAILALADADAILADGKVSATNHVKALAVRGLALAAQDDFAAARKVLIEATRNQAFPKDGGWRELVFRTALELNDPDATIEQVRTLLAKGESDKALAIADRGLRIFDRDNFGTAHLQLAALRSGALQRSTPVSVDSERAESHFAAGLRHYFGHRFTDAETEFLAAVKHHGDDARFHYYLGLTRQSLGKSEAANESLQVAVELERKGKPGTIVLNRIFERVQGPSRLWLDGYRK